MIISFHLGNKFQTSEQQFHKSCISFKLLKLDAAQTWLVLPRHLKLWFLSNIILMRNSQKKKKKKYLGNAIMLRGNSQ